VQGTDEQKAQGRLVLTEVLEALRIVAVLLSPVTPTLSKAIYHQLGFSEEESEKITLEDAEWGGQSSCPLSTIPSCESPPPPPPPPTNPRGCGDDKLNRIKAFRFFKFWLVLGGGGGRGVLALGLQRHRMRGGGHMMGCHVWSCPLPIFRLLQAWKRGYPPRNPSRSSQG